MLERLAGLLAGVWLGAQLTVGYVVAPVLFGHLPKAEAGDIAGVLFYVVTYIGLAAWLLVWAGRRKTGGRATAAVKLLLVLLLLNQFAVTPVIQALKTDSSNWLLSLAGGSFGVWHGISSLIYLLCSLLGVALVWRLNRFEWR